MTPAELEVAKIKGKWVGSDKTPGDSQNIDDDAGVFGVHGALLPSGNVIWFSGHVETIHYLTDAIEWNPLYGVDYNNDNWKPNRYSPGGPNPSPNPTIKKHKVPLDIDIFCSHLAHLPDGRILLAGGSTRINYWGATNIRNDNGDYIYNMYTGPGRDDSRGIKDLLIFDPNASGDESIKKVGEMVEARWYPTVVSLPDGNIAVFSGWTDETAVGGGQPMAETIEIIEVDKIDYDSPYYSPKVLNILTDAQGTQAFDGAFFNRILPIYPGMHLGPNGKLYSTSTAFRYEPNRRDGLVMTQTQVTNGPPFPLLVFAQRFPSVLDIDPKNLVGVWNFLGAINDGNPPDEELREEGTSIVLHPAGDGRILILGGNSMGGIHTVPYANINPIGPPDVSKKVSVIETSLDAVRQNDLSMRYNRTNVNAVLLPDETVLIIGGHDSYKWHQGAHQKVCEIYEPYRDVTQKDEFLVPNYENDPVYIADNAAFKADDSNYVRFKETDELDDGRTYHSNAILLPDGSVIVSGGVDPDQNEVLPDGNVLPQARNLKRHEIYRPSYFYLDGDRPIITQIDTFPFAIVDALRLEYNQTFEIHYTGVSSISHVLLMRIGSMTHHTDSDQRSIDVQIVSQTNGSGLVTCKIPNEPKEAPPGHYMLWVRNGELPCVQAPIIKINAKMDGDGPIGANTIDVSATTTTENFSHSRVLNGVTENIDVIVTKTQEFIVELSINGLSIPLTYFTASKSWGAKGLVYGRFITVKGLAKYLIDNRIV